MKDETSEKIDLYYEKLLLSRSMTIHELIKRGQSVIGVDNTSGGYILLRKPFKYKMRSTND